MSDSKKKTLFALLAEADFETGWPVDANVTPEYPALDELSLRYQYKLGFPEAIQFVKAGKNALKRAVECAQYIENTVEFYAGNTQVDYDPDVLAELREACCEAIAKCNAAATNFTYVFRKTSPDLNLFGVGKALRKYEKGYGILTTDSGVYLRLPHAPYSVANLKNKKPFHFARFRSLSIGSLLNEADLPYIASRKILYILHAYHDRSNYRISPDFDNYDLKYVIDSVMQFFGGDSKGNVMVVHDALITDKLEESTYIAVIPIQKDIPFEGLIGDIREHFARIQVKENE